MGGQFVTIEPMQLRPGDKFKLITSGHSIALSAMGFPCKTYQNVVEIRVVGFKDRQPLDKVIEIHPGAKVMRLRS
jgi:hypothetical protein